MIVGSGLLAKGFAKIASKHEDVIFMCSGVSGSTTVSTTACEREYDLVYKTIQLNPEKLMVYTSSLSCYNDQTPYDKHKINVEKIVQRTKHLIVRIGNLVGPDQKQWQFYPSIVSQVKRGSVKVADCTRDIIDIRDYVSFIDNLIGIGCNFVTSFGTLYPPAVIEIVYHLEKKYGGCEKIMIEGSGVSKPDFSIIDKDYYKMVIDTYETDYTLDNW